MAASAQLASPAGAAQRDIALQPGDKVQLKFWREPDLSGEFVVASDGAVVFPKIGRVVVAAISTDSLRAVLVDRYSVSIRSPAIEVIALRRVRVGGEVRNPGFYFADPTVTVSGAVALAGGLTSDARRSRVDLVRAGTNSRIALSDGVALADVPLQSGDQVIVPQRSWLSRNTALVASGLTAFALVIAAAIRP